MADEELDGCRSMKRVRPQAVGSECLGLSFRRSTLMMDCNDGGEIMKFDVMVGVVGT